MIKSLPAVLLLATLALTGCRVQTIDGRYVEPSQPVVQRSLNIEGPWLMLRGDTVRREIDVRRTRGGIFISWSKDRQFARRIGPAVFENDRGQIYQFFSAVEGRYENRKTGTFRNLVRP